ncbi:MAG: hypothetical protein IH849_08035 [Acidobacteria bacterium]|nr:hypothetical protein [Acidobacteriota bacterium]
MGRVLGGTLALPELLVFAWVGEEEIQHRHFADAERVRPASNFSIAPGRRSAL